MRRVRTAHHPHFATCAVTLRIAVQMFIVREVGASTHETASARYGAGMLV